MYNDSICACEVPVRPTMKSEMDRLRDYVGDAEEITSQIYGLLIGEPPKPDGIKPANMIEDVTCIARRVEILRGMLREIREVIG